jgi:hypothetical protein
MGHSARNSYERQDDEDAFMALNSNLPAELAGLPDSWRHYGWWFASTVFAVLWMLDSWTSGGHSAGEASVSRLAESFLSLLLAFAVCYGIFQICKRRSERLGHVLCIMAAAAMLATHGF